MAAAEGKGPVSTLSLFAAGSLRYVMADLLAAARSTLGIATEVRHGPAGLLRQRIESGERPDIFASADLGHPERLAAEGLCSPTVLFARNPLCAMARSDLGLTAANFCDKLLDPAVKIGTSTPLNDPSGDYAWQIFRRIDTARPGAFAVLEAKAKKLVGGSEGPMQRGAAQFLADGTADVFFGYQTGAKSVLQDFPGATVVPIPAEFAVSAAYGLAVLNGARADAYRLALFFVSMAGQRLFRQHGFEPVALPLT